VASELAVARRESPHRAQQHAGLGRILVTEMPHTLAAFRAGRITEWAATVLVRETACLDLADRQTVDQLLASDAERLERMGVRELEAAVQKLAYRLDPGSYVARRARADADRRVTLRPAPDTMAHLSALTPAVQGVAMYAALTTHADRLRAAGDPRSRGQIMADTLVERITGQRSATAVPVTIDLVIRRGPARRGGGAGMARRLRSGAGRGRAAAGDPSRGSHRDPASLRPAGRR
jgi:hypothetical protein